MLKHQGRILIVEDNTGFRFCYKAALEDDGYTVLEAEDGKQGWEMALAHVPDLILLDLMLPKLHGFEVLKKIRTDPSTKHIPVVIMSVMEAPEDRQKAAELGANEYLVKGSDSPRHLVKMAVDILIKA